MSSSTETSPPLSLTERQQAELAATELIKVLGTLPAGGRIEGAQLEQLRHWLFGHGGADIPGIAYLTKIVVRVLADGTLSDADAIDFYLGIERILPVTERGIEREMRALAGTPEGSTVRGDWRNDAITDAQRNYIAAVGGAAAAGASKGEASLLIDQLLRKKPISRPQQMELRFWNQQLGADAGPREVFEWRRKFHAEDPERQAAWDLFKLEVGETGLKGDPLRVTVGLGRSYLSRVKKGGAKAVPVPRTLTDSNGSRSGAGRPSWRWLFWLGAAGGLAFAIWFFAFRASPSDQPSAPVPRRPLQVRTVQPVAQPVQTVRPVRSVQPEPPAPRALVVSTSAPPKAETRSGSESAADLIAYARKMHFTALFTIGGQRVAMIDGVQCRAGAKVGPTNDYTVSEIDPATRSIILADSKGNAVRRLIE